MNHSDEEIDVHEIKAKSNRRIATADGKRRGKGRQILFNKNSTRCDTMRLVTYSKATTNGFQDFNLYKDDYYEKK